MRFVETTAPLLRVTIMAVLIQLRQPVSCVLSSTNVPSLTKAVKQSNGHPNIGEQGATKGGKFSISQQAESAQLLVSVGGL